MLWRNSQTLPTTPSIPYDGGACDSCFCVSVSGVSCDASRFRALASRGSCHHRYNLDDGGCFPVRTRPRDWQQAERKLIRTRVAHALARMSPARGFACTNIRAQECQSTVTDSLEVLGAVLAAKGFRLIPTNATFPGQWQRNTNSWMIRRCCLCCIRPRFITASSKGGCVWTHSIFLKRSRSQAASSGRTRQQINAMRYKSAGKRLGEPKVCRDHYSHCATVLPVRRFWSQISKFWIFNALGILWKYKKARQNLAFFSRKGLTLTKHCLRCIFITNLFWRETMTTQDAKNTAKILLLPWKCSMYLNKKQM